MNIASASSAYSTTVDGNDDELLTSKKRIQCTNSQVVTGIDLNMCGLHGELPEESFTGLVGGYGRDVGVDTSFKVIKLAGNHMIGTVPSAIGKLTNLRVLDLSDNMLSGTIPTSLSNLSNLEILNLGYNQISGDNLRHLFQTSTKLKEINVTHNIGLTGEAFHYDSFHIYPMSDLRTLDFSHCGFKGRIWPGMFEHLTSLTTLQISNNQFTGQLVYDMIENIRHNITTINVSHNGFFGVLPKEIGLLTKLSMLDMSYNRFSGTIPTEIGQCYSLEQLYLNDNDLDPLALPDELANVTSLELLTIYNNDNLITNNDVDYFYVEHLCPTIQSNNGTIQIQSSISSTDPAISSTNNNNRGSNSSTALLCSCCT